MGRAHYRGKRPADDEPIEGTMSAMQRAVTGLYAKRGTPSHVTRTREDSSESSARTSRADQAEVSAPASEAQPALYAAEAIRRAVNHRLKSVVREIRTLRSVGAGGG